MGENLLLGQKLALQQRQQRAFSPRGGVAGGLPPGVTAGETAAVTEAAVVSGVPARAGLAGLFAAVLAAVFACLFAWPAVAAAGDEPFVRRYEQRGDFQREAQPRDVQPRDSRFAGDSWGQGPRREAAGYQAYPSGDAPDGARQYRFSSEERRQLRRDLHEAGRDLYAPRR